MQTDVYWILQWPDGSYYSTDGVYIGTTPSVSLAQKFASAEAAQRWHDTHGHLYHLEMKALCVHTWTDITDEIVLSSLKESAVLSSLKESAYNK